MGYFNTKKEQLKSTGRKVLQVDQIVQSKNNIVDNFKEISSGLRNRRTAETAEMSFENVVKHFNLTEDDLIYKYKTQTIRFFVNLFLVLGLFVYSIYLLSTSNYLTAVLSLIVSIVPISLMFDSSVQASRLKVRRFITVSEWFKQKDFIPNLNSFKNSLKTRSFRD